MSKFIARVFFVLSALSVVVGFFLSRVSEGYFSRTEFSFIAFVPWLAGAISLFAAGALFLAISDIQESLRTIAEQQRQHAVRSEKAGHAGSSDMRNWSAKPGDNPYIPRRPGEDDDQYWDRVQRS